MGHLVLTKEQGELNDGLDICRLGIEKYRYGCFTGVFMENLTRENLVDHGYSEPIKWDQAALSAHKSLCSQYTGVVSRACWREVAHLFHQLTGPKPQELYKLCSENQTYLAKLYLLLLLLL